MVRLSSQARKAFQGSSRGLTMIEVLIAIAILGIISITFLSVLSTASLSVGLADERTVAESLARRQIEDVKNQIYSSAPAGGVATYSKISNIPAGYSIWSVNRNGTVVADIVGIPWDSESNEPVSKDVGLQKIALVIKDKDKENPAQDKVIYTFIDNNSAWHPGSVEITLEGYKVDR
ncbi:MAG: prepilin-type N-terminal cleavage/methylation domain-containing protein [Dehalococcoidia bacterium]